MHIHTHTHLALEIITMPMHPALNSSDSLKLA